MGTIAGLVEKDDKNISEESSIPFYLINHMNQHNYWGRVSGSFGKNGSVMFGVKNRINFWVQSHSFSSPGQLQSVYALNKENLLNWRLVNQWPVTYLRRDTGK